MTGDGTIKILLCGIVMGYIGGSSDGGRVGINSSSTICTTVILENPLKSVIYDNLVSCDVVYHIDHKWNSNDDRTNIIYIYILLS